MLVYEASDTDISNAIFLYPLKKIKLLREEI